LVGVSSSTGGPETGDKGGQYFKSQWLNPVGGALKTPLAADRRSVLAKYGSKFAALAGAVPVPVKPAPAAPKAPPVPSPVRPSTINYQPSTMENAWAALNEAHPTQSGEANEKLWFDTIARLFPNKSNTDLTPHEWGKLKAEFTDPLPM
jgi:hypothetical protein